MVASFEGRILLRRALARPLMLISDDQDYSPLLVVETGNLFAKNNNLFLKDLLSWCILEFVVLGGLSEYPSKTLSSSMALDRKFH